MPLDFQALALFGEMHHAERRRESARALAAHLGAEDLLIFAADPEVGRMLPAPGFAQTLRGGRAWRAFLAECARPGVHHTTLPDVDSAALKPAAGCAAVDGSVLIVLGGEPDPQKLAALAALLPVLAAAFQGERVAQSAAAQAQMARAAESQAKTLADSLNKARQELQHALREAQQARRRADFLAEASAILADPLAQSAALQALARLVVPFLGDMCAMYLVEDSRVRPVAMMHENISHPQPWAELDHHFWKESNSPLAAALRTGQSSLMVDLGRDLASSRITPSERLPLAADVPVNALLAAPLVSRGRVLGGVVCAVSSPGRTYDSTDLALLDELARRAALAIDNAQLYAESRQLNAELEQRVLERTKELRAANAALEVEVGERKRAEERLAEFNHQLQELSGRLQVTREDERARISREIHDVLGQELTALRLEVSRLQRNAADLAGSELKEHTRAMLAMIDQSIQTVRRIATDLRPSILDHFGLVTALEWQVEEFEKQSGIRATFTATAEHIHLDPAAATAVFRITQEALTNVVRHAQATDVAVRLAEDHSAVRLEIQDNGCGMQAQDMFGTKSLGLLGMRERVRQLSGELTIQSAQGAGTTVLVTVPLGSPTPDYAPETS